MFGKQLFETLTLSKEESSSWPPRLHDLKVRAQNGEIRVVDIKREKTRLTITYRLLT